MSIVGSEQWMYSAGAEFYEFPIEQSLRFEDGDSAYLSRTPASAGNRKTWTWSGWVKRGNLGEQSFLDAYSDDSNRLIISFSATNALNVFGRTGGSTVINLTTSQLFRDVSSWYHIVLKMDTTQATSTDRVKIYVNGVQVSSFSGTTYPTLNYDTFVNATVSHSISSNNDSGGREKYFDGYMADVNVIDGQALDATSFGETKSGIWIPKDTSGLTFGTNGFRLEYADSAAIGDDTSGNTNDWTVNNLVASDVVLDSPTNNFANLMIHNSPAANSNAFSEGNLRFTPGTGDSARNTNRMAISNMLVSSGKWYAEAYIVDNGSSHFIGVGPKQTVSPTANNTRYAYVYSSGGDSYVRTGASESVSTYASSYTVGDVIGIYVDMDAATPVVYFSKNGQWSNGSGSWNQSSPSGGITLGDTFFTESADFAGTFTFQAVRASGAVSPTTIWNFGQDSTFAGNETAGGNTDANGIGDFFSTVPDDALALCSANLPQGAIDTLADETPEDYFNTVLFSATSGVADSVTGYGFAPDWIWTKARNAAQSHQLFDNVRGDGVRLITNSTGAESALGASYLSLEDDGFDYGTGTFTSNTYVGWGWKANGSGVSNTDGSITSTVSVGATSQQNWFSVVGYTGTGANATVGHGLGVAPDLVIVKNRDIVSSFLVRLQILATNQTLLLENTTAPISTDYWQSTQPDSSVFSVSSNSEVNGSGNDLIAYCFANAEGLCKVGKYVGSAFVYTGFRPAFVLIKKASGGTFASGQSDWVLYDGVRNPSNPTDLELVPNSSQVEDTYGTGGEDIDMLSNGFKILTSSSQMTGTSTYEYIYLAIAEQPFAFANAR